MLKAAQIENKDENFSERNRELKNKTSTFGSIAGHFFVCLKTNSDVGAAAGNYVGNK